MVESYEIQNCQYSIDKLEKRVYLLPKDTVGIVSIDNGEAYIKDPSATPILLEGFSIAYTEDSSLDERYQFSKEVKLSVHGYFPKVTFDDEYHVVLRDKDNNYWVVNIDFPVDITYNFNFGNSQYQTDLSFKCLSNLPMLLLQNNWGETVITECKPYTFNRLEEFKIIDRYDTALDVANKKIYTFNGGEFKDVIPLKNSISIQENYDGKKVTTTLEFSIKLNDYEKSWQYNVLEFMKNKKSVIINADDNTFYLGFNLGLVPNYNLNASTSADQNNVIEITLEETSNEGNVVENDITEEIVHRTEWKNVKYIGELPCWECLDGEYGEFMLKEEYDVIGNPLGNYMCKEGWEDVFEGLNIVGTFAEGDILPCGECGYSYCSIDTDIPNSLTFRNGTPQTFTLISDCPITITSSASWLKHFVEDTELRVWVEGINQDATAYLEITSGKNVLLVKVDYIAYKQPITPTYSNITCLAQTVTFDYAYQYYDVSVKRYDSRLTIYESQSGVQVQVPLNESTYDVETYEIVFEVCYEDEDGINCYEETIEISQDHVYEEWRDNGGYICDGTASYHELQRYTGTTSSSINTRTLETKKGEQIESADTRCITVIVDWIRDSIICFEGSKYYQQQRVESYDGGQTWELTGEYRLGDLYEADSLECQRQNYFTLIPTEDGSFSFQPSTQGNDIEYSTDGQVWEALENNSTPTFSANTKVHFRGECITYANLGVGTFSATTSFIAEGNPMSLFYGDEYTMNDAFERNYSLARLFQNSTITSAYNLYLNFALKGYAYHMMFQNSTLKIAPRLPSAELMPSCYARMFEGCAKLTQAPSTLPVMTLADNCYQAMFYECTALTEAPQLPATTLAVNCYNSMFYGCSALTTAPQLPATTLANSCYQYMFFDCASLVEAPELPSETIVYNAYARMFNGCYRLSYIKCLATSITQNATISWVSGVSGGGVFVKNANMTSWTTDGNGIPNNWAVQNA